MSTIRRNYSARVARGDRIVDGVVVRAAVLTDEDVAILRGLVRRHYPRDARVQVVESLIARGLLESKPNPRGGLPLLAITGAGFRALRLCEEVPS